MAASPPRWRRRPIDVPGGTTLVGALSRGTIPILTRSIRYHRPRAAFCGVGACSQCLVRVNGVPNVRACQYRPAPGDEAAPETGWPSPTFDLGAVFDAVFPGGIDTVQGFRRPRWATPLYHWIVRRLAGTGRLPDPGLPPLTVPPTDLVTEVLVVGGGTSGAAAAKALRSSGREVVVIDRTAGDARPGGALRGLTAGFLPPPTVGSSRPFTLLASADDGRAAIVRARSAIIATGGYDAGLLFAGSDRPGVMTGDAVDAIAGPDGRVPFERALVVGGGERAAALLERFGPSVEAVAAPGVIAPSVTERAARLEIPLYPRTLLLGAEGRRRVHHVRLRARGGGAPFRLAVDAVVLAVRRLPHVQLLFQAGARMAWSDERAAYYPVLTDGGRTTVPDLWAIGEAAGWSTSAGAATSGQATAAAIAGAATLSSPGTAASASASELPGYYRELRPYLERDRRIIACACEDVLLHEIARASRRGFRGIEVIKRYTGVGTGICQGRFCLPDALLWLAMLEDRPPTEVGYITQRPPVFPTTVAALANLPVPEDRP